MALNVLIWKTVIARPKDLCNVVGEDCDEGRQDDPPESCNVIVQSEVLEGISFAAYVLVDSFHRPISSLAAFVSDFIMKTEFRARI